MSGRSQKNKSMLGIMHRIVMSCGKHKARVRAAYVTGFCKGLFQKVPLMLCFFTVAWFMAGEMTKQKCLYMGLLLLLCVILQAVFQHLSDRLQSAAGYMVFADLRLRLGSHLRSLPMGYFTSGNLGKISSVLSTDMIFIEENCMAVLSDLSSFIISQFLMVCCMFYMNVWLGLLSCAFVCIFLVLGNLMMRTTLSHSVQKQEASQKLTEAVIEFAEGIGIIKTYNLTGERSTALTDAFQKSCDDSIAFETDYAPWAIALHLAFGIGSVAMLAAAILLCANGTISQVYLLGMVLFLFDIFVSIRTYYQQIARLTVTDACLDRIESVFNEPELCDSGTDTLPAQQDFSGSEISFEHVSFAYDKAQVLSDVSFDIQKGQMVALVGQSGGGKSTVANLLARFWDVQDGAVKVRGKNIKDIPLSQLMANVSMVFQRVYLFQDTVYNNIAMGRPNATREEVYEAAKKAQCYDFIMQLPDGFETVVGEGGASLSGGEQQRISIARCILKDTPIVILDEATASVDADNESAIQKAISELCRGKTLLVIAHRLKTVSSADRILVIGSGGIEESGTHEELMALGGAYSTMVTKQNSAFTQWR